MDGLSRSRLLNVIDNLLGGSSRIANKDMMFTFGCPNTLYLYHREKGGMLGVVEFMNSNFHYYRELSNGCGTGFEYLIRAEYCLECGELANAEHHARKAIYKAQTMVTVIICANFALARLNAAKGNFFCVYACILDFICRFLIHY